MFWQQARENKECCVKFFVTAFFGGFNLDSTYMKLVSCCQLQLCQLLESPAERPGKCSRRPRLHHPCSAPVPCASQFPRCNRHSWPYPVTTNGRSARHTSLSNPTKREGNHPKPPLRLACGRILAVKTAKTRKNSRQLGTCSVPLSAYLMPSLKRHETARRRVRRLQKGRLSKKKAKQRFLPTHDMKERMCSRMDSDWPNPLRIFFATATMLSSNCRLLASNHYGGDKGGPAREF